MIRGETMGGENKRARAYVALTRGHLGEEVYLSLSFAARGVLCDLWRVVDGVGRFHAGKRALVRALGAVSWDDLSAPLTELTAAGWVTLYEVDGIGYGEIGRFAADVGNMADKMTRGEIPGDPSKNAPHAGALHAGATRAHDAGGLPGRVAGAGDAGALPGRVAREKKRKEKKREDKRGLLSVREDQTRARARKASPTLKEMEEVTAPDAESIALLEKLSEARERLAGGAS